MEREINIETILKKHGRFNKIMSVEGAKAAIKEIVNTTLDECKKEILIAQKWRGVGPVPNFPRIIEKVRNTINYE